MRIKARSVLMGGILVALVAGGGLYVSNSQSSGDGGRRLSGAATQGGPAGAGTPSGSGSGVASACRPAPLAERAARVLVMGLPEVTRASDPLVTKLVELGVGGVLISGYNVESTTQVTELVRGIRSRSTRPLLVSTDEEPGRVSTFVELFGPTPSARRLANERSTAEVRDIARQTGSRLAAMGIDFDLAPVADLDEGPSRGIIGDRSFSADPDTAARYALAYASGLADAGVRPLAKHFPGHGRSTDDSHLRATETVRATLQELLTTDVRPFRSMIDAGIPVVMMNHVEYSLFEPGLPASLSPKAYELLRSLGFQGAAITDSVGMAAVNLRYHPSNAAVAAVKAGADGVLMTDGWSAENMRDTLVEAVQSGGLSEERLNQAAGRMTALAGGDPVAFACQNVRIPQLTRTP